MKLLLIFIFLSQIYLTSAEVVKNNYWVEDDWYFVEQDSIQQSKKSSPTEYIKGMNACEQISFKDSLNGLIFCQIGLRAPWVFKTTNGGSFWKEIFIDTAQKIEDSIQPPGYFTKAAVNDEQVIISTLYNNAEPYDNTGYILRSTDFGNNFKKIYPDTGMGFFDISMLNAKYGALLRYYAVLITNDSGKTWAESKKKPDSLSNFRFLQVVGENKIFTYNVWWPKPGSGEYRIYYSSDNGNNWETIIPPGFNIYKSYFFNENEGLIIGCGQKNDQSTHDTLFVKYTYDRGKTWLNTWDTVLSNSMRLFHKSINEIKFYNRNNGIFVGDYGVIFQTTDGGKNWTFIGLKTEPPKGASTFIFKRLEFVNTSKIITTGIFHANNELLFIPLKTPVSVRDELEEKESITLYPNPSSDFLTIQPSEGLKPSDGYKVQVFDMLGNEVIYTPSLRDTTQEENFSIDVSALQPGVYFIRIGDRVQKFVKI